jgi:hypothetical protein
MPLNLVPYRVPMWLLSSSHVTLIWSAELLLPWSNTWWPKAAHSPFFLGSMELDLPPTLSPLPQPRPAVLVEVRPPLLPLPLMLLMVLVDGLLDPLFNLEDSCWLTACLGSPLLGSVGLLAPPEAHHASDPVLTRRIALVSCFETSVRSNPYSGTCIALVSKLAFLY